MMEAQRRNNQIKEKNMKKRDEIKEKKSNKMRR